MICRPQTRPHQAELRAAPLLRPASLPSLLFLPDYCLCARPALPGAAWPHVRRCHGALLTGRSPPPHGPGCWRCWPLVGRHSGHQTSRLRLSRWVGRRGRAARGARACTRNKATELWRLMQAARPNVSTCPELPPKLQSLRLPRSASQTGRAGGQRGGRGCEKAGGQRSPRPGAARACRRGRSDLAEPAQTQTGAARARGASARGQAIHSHQP